MKSIDFRVFYRCMIISSIVSCLSAIASAADSRQSDAASPKKSRQMTQEELQSAVISYANRYIAIIGQAATQLEGAVPTDQGRLNAARRKVYSMTAVMETAAGPNPGPALLDLVVNATLSRMVWEDYWVPQVFGKPAMIMVTAFRKMEVDAWELAAKVMTPAQRQEFRDLIEDWYADHPGQVSVDYVTFSDFGDIGTKPNLKNIQKPGGLLAPIREATEAVDDVRMLRNSLVRSWVGLVKKCSGVPTSTMAPASMKMTRSDRPPRGQSPFRGSPPPWSCPPWPGFS
jgi:hypothetical protein